MIVKMKKLRVIAMADEREKLIDGMLRLGCMQVSEPTDKLNDPAWAALLHREDSALTERRIQQTSVQAALDAIGRYGRTKEKALRLRPEVTESEFMDDAAAKEAGAASGEINDALAFLAELQTDENRMLSLRASLLPWERLDAPLEHLPAVRVGERSRHAVLNGNPLRPQWLDAPAPRAEAVRVYLNDVFAGIGAPQPDGSVKFRAMLYRPEAEP